MFEGKEIKYVDVMGNHLDAVVVACVKNIGISIVQKGFNDHLLFCLIMKNSPSWRNIPYKKGNITKSEKVFTKIRKGIMRGTIDRFDNGCTSYIEDQQHIQSMCSFNK